VAIPSPLLRRTPCGAHGFFTAGAGELFGAGGGVANLTGVAGGRLGMVKRGGVGNGAGVKRGRAGFVRLNGIGPLFGWRA